MTKKTPIRSLKQALNHGLILKQLHRVIQFNQKAWLKEYIDMNTELRKQPKNYIAKDFVKLINNAAFGKTMENMRKYRDNKLVTIDRRRNQLVSEPNHHKTKLFSEDLLAIEIKMVNVKINKPVYLGMSALEVSKDIWIYMDTGSFIIDKTEDLYKDITDDIKKGCDTSNYEVDRPLPKGLNKKVIVLMKDELGGKIVIDFVALRPKTYSYLTDDDNYVKKLKKQKNV